MLLLELDRGIDLLALGAKTTDGGPSEWRAFAFWAIVNVIIRVLSGHYLPGADQVSVPALPVPTGPMAGSEPIKNEANNEPRFKTDLELINTDIKNATQLVPGLKRTFQRYIHIPLTQVPITPLDEKKLKSISEELRVQLSLEDRWENLVRTIAPEAGDQEAIFALLKRVIEEAAADVDTGHLPRETWPLPPQFEQSLDWIVRKWG